MAPAGTGDPVDPEEAAEKADFPVSDPTTEEVVEQEGDKVDAEEIVEENEKH